ncbi:hypothetical protein COO60DRAFT_874280 [Scenedesmus sp. NREL 46B-D3]|nr:hypothetical protein COO60DRAFT_874280 [Scenedesmus sp. NREL 46B-D3]
MARSPVLRLRGLPFLATTLDVKDFFSDFEVSDVYICRRNGRSTGEAYVVLHTPEAAQNAMLQLNKKYMASRYIELFEAAKADLAAVKKVLEESRLQGYVVRLRGLPYSATPADITLFMQGLQLAEVEDAIVIAHSADGRPTGEAYVELADEQALSLAMTRHKELMGNRYIEVFNSSKVDKVMAQQYASSHQGSQPRSRWLPGGAGGVMGGSGLKQHMFGVPAAAAAYISGHGMADQLAGALSATHLSMSPPHANSVMGNACMMPYPSSSGTLSISPSNSAEAAAIAAGQRFLASPAASAASSAEFRMPQQQAVVAVSGVGPGQAAVNGMTGAAMTAGAAGAGYQVLSPGSVMMGADGQTVYYMTTSPGMWPGASRVMSLLPVCGAPADAAAAAMPGCAAMPRSAVQPMMMPGEGTLPCMQPGEARLSRCCR